MSGRESHVAILGAGPVGLEAALAAAEAGLPFTLYETSAEIAGSVRAWGHVRLFTSWDDSVSVRMAKCLERAGHPVPRRAACPTGSELVEQVLRPLSRLPAIASRLELGVTVVAVGRERILKQEGIGSPTRAEYPFRLLLREADGRERVAHAGVVLDCTGTYGHPNTLGSGGIPAPGERELGDEIVRAIPDIAASPAEWKGKYTFLAGAGHSAQTAAIALSDLASRFEGTRLLWAVRDSTPDWGVVEGDPLPDRAALGARVRELAAGAVAGVHVRTGVVVDSLSRQNGSYRVDLRGVDGAVDHVIVDRILSLTGAVGDDRIYRQLQVHECYATSGPMKLAAALMGEASTDCLAQTSHGADTLRNPEPDFFILGAKSYGRQNTFLLRTGWQQVDEVFGILT